MCSYLKTIAAVTVGQGPRFLIRHFQQAHLTQYYTTGGHFYPGGRHWYKPVHRTHRILRRRCHRQQTRTSRTHPIRPEVVRGRRHAKPVRRLERFDTRRLQLGRRRGTRERAKFAESRARTFARFVHAARATGDFQRRCCALPVNFVGLRHFPLRFGFQTGTDLGPTLTIGWLPIDDVIVHIDDGSRSVRVLVERFGPSWIV